MSKTSWHEVPLGVWPLPQAVGRTMVGEPYAV